jgi:hypothetical protein
MVEKQRNNATASAYGTVYQLYVALLKCFELCSGQRVIIERYGDVTTNSLEQIEVKRYAGNLTDSHLNFWNTLYNWTQPSFKPSLYSSLLLCTTQPIGPRSLLRQWNSSPPKRRLEILRSICPTNKRPIPKRTKHRDKKVKGTVSPATVLQKQVLSRQRRDKLLEAIPIISIASSSPDFQAGFQMMQDRFCKSILQRKRHEFLKQLLGFLLSPPVLGEKTWEITYEQFDEQVRTLTPQYCHGTHQFPMKHIRNIGPLTAEQQDSSMRHLFVQKIVEIEYHEMIVQAVQEHGAARDTILEEFQDYQVSDSKYLDYAQEVIRMYRPLYKIACRKMTDAIRDSKNFFDERMAELPPTFPGFETTPVAFKNGLLHMQQDDPQHQLQWRLCEL